MAIELPSQCLSAREPRRQSTIDISASDTPTLDPSVVTVAESETSTRLSSSDLENKSVPPAIALQIAEEPASSTHLDEDVTPLGKTRDSLVATPTDKEAPRNNVTLESTDQVARSRHEVVDRVVNDSAPDGTDGGAVAPDEETEIKQVSFEDMTHGGSVMTHRGSVSDEQVSAIAAAASAAVIAAATQTSSQTSSQTSNKGSSPPSSNRPHPVENRSNTTSDSSTNPKGSSKTYSASPSSSQRGGPALPRDSRNSPGKRRPSVIRQQPGQALTDAKPVSRRKSVVKGAFPVLPDLSDPGSLVLLGKGVDSNNSSGSSSGAGPHEDAPLSSGGSGHKPTKSKRRRSVNKNLALVPSSYHKTWSKWDNGRGIVEKISCLQLEEQVLAGLQTEGTLIKLGLRYARWSGTSLAAILLLEHAAALHESAPRTHEFWNSMGNAHLDIFLRNRKFLPAAGFHLERCVKSLTRALAFMESMADPQLLLRFALCLFWHPEHGHLERADEIFRQLFTKFASFCDKDRVNLLFLHFQVLHRLKMFAEACERIDKIIALATSTAALVAADTKSAPRPRPLSTVDESSALPPAYELADYWMMKMQCQQASSDYVQATATFSRVVGAKGFVQDGNLTDKQYLELWLGVAEKCFTSRTTHSRPSTTQWHSTLPRSRSCSLQSTTS